MKRKDAYFEEIYDAHWLEIRKFIFVEARRDAALTEDIFQNTWENAFRYLHTLKDRAAVRAWLYSIARNETKRYFHNNRIRLFPNTISIDEPDGPDAEDPIESTFPEVLANAELLAELLNRLTEEEQQLILLHYYYDLSLKEIAEINDVNYNTLKSITRRAMARLRSLAAAEQEETDDR